VLSDILRTEKVNRALVFTRTKHGADKVVRALNKSGIAAEAIHGNKSQNQRERVLASFREGKIRTLVATDIAARGIDVDGVSHVINYDLPNIPESYVHRIGRTARAGADGIAISFCSRDEAPFLRDIERLIRITIPSTDQRTDRRPATATTQAPRQNTRHADANGQRAGKSRRRSQRPAYPGNGQNRQQPGQGQAEGRSQSNPEQIASVGFMRPSVRDRSKSPADAGGAAR
jgi:superfamily II DNA/RNA helicase